jgi:seryl-tRNA synthetase
MLDIRQLDKDPEGFQKRISRRGTVVSLGEVVELSAKRRALIAKGDELRFQKAKMENSMKQVDRQSEAFAQFREEMRISAQEIKQISDELSQVEEQLAQKVLYLPNLPDDDIPDGASDADNQEVRLVGTKKNYEFEPKEHWALGESLGYLDFERATKIAQSRFSVLKGPLARMERALVQFMLDLHTIEHGYQEILPPFLVNHASMQGTGQFPKFQEDAFLLERDQLVLVPTAEVPVTNLHRDEVLDVTQLPIKYTAYTPCFRREAGSYGRDTRGLIRQHQFEKIELVQFVKPEESDVALEALTSHAEEVLKRLGLHYRVVMLCAGDIGFSSAKTYDLEVWLPGQKAYREISSCSNFRDFQARRAAIRFKPSVTEKPQLVHTLNGSGLAVGRTLVAIMENYQQADGSILVPEALQPYMGGLKEIR